MRSRCCPVRFFTASHEYVVSGSSGRLGYSVWRCRAAGPGGGWWLAGEAGGCRGLVVVPNRERDPN